MDDTALVVDSEEKLGRTWVRVRYGVLENMMRVNGGITKTINSVEGGAFQLHELA